MRNILKWILFLSLWWGLIFFAVKFLTAPLPVVYWSASRDRCERVIIDGLCYGCEVLDQREIVKYEKIWVE